MLSADGALCAPIPANSPAAVPKDKFTVRDATTDKTDLVGRQPVDHR